MESRSRADRPLVDQLHRRAVASGRLDAASSFTRPELVDEIESVVADEAPLLSEADSLALADQVAAQVTGLGALEPLLDDPLVTELMVNGPGPVWVERRGRVDRSPVTLDGPEIERVIERVLTPLGLRCDRSAPVVDARLPDGSRFHAVVQPVAVDGPYVTIRRFAARPLPMAAFAPDPHLEALFVWMVRAAWNILVSGGTSSGKTTLLNALSASVGSTERVVTIEETAELRLRLPHAVRLEGRPANAEGAGEVTTDRLVRAALRMRPDRIIVGEVRGSEARSLLDALNTGHAGSMCTIHANGAGEALDRLAGLALRGAPGIGSSAVAGEVARSIDAVVHLERTSAGSRQVVDVVEVAADGSVEAEALWARDTGPGCRPRRPSRRLGVGGFAGSSISVRSRAAKP